MCFRTLHVRVVCLSKLSIIAFFSSEMCLAILVEEGAAFRFVFLRVQVVGGVNVEDTL